MATDPRVQSPSAPSTHPEPNPNRHAAASRAMGSGAAQPAGAASGVVKRQHGGVRGGGAARAAAKNTGDDTSNGGDLVVGAGVTFSGRIAACQRLVVGGRVDAHFPGERLEVRDGGRFQGEADVRSAEIHGTFEGTLRVAGTLALGATARVSGAIRYDTLEIAAGGELRGDVDRMDAHGDAPALGPAPAPGSLSADG